MEADRLNGRVLFIGWPAVSHNLNWIALCQAIGLTTDEIHLSGTRRVVRGPGGAFLRIREPLLDDGERAERDRLLDDIAERVDRVRPNIVHCFGLDPASYLYLEARERVTEESPLWVVQARGGPEIDLHRHIPADRRKMGSVFAACDGFLADNEPAYQFAVANGLSAAARAAWGGQVPGSGGVELSPAGSETPATRDLPTILWPKAYQTTSVDGMPILEALRLAWPDIPPHRLEFCFAYQDDLMAWARKLLPQEALGRLTVSGPLPQSEYFRRLRRASILLAPSLLDGVPNVLLEAMAFRILPIVSPHPTLPAGWLEAPGLLFARNLYPEEIATRLVHAARLSDTRRAGLLEGNRRLVAEYADRRHVRTQVRDFYAFCLKRGTGSAAR